MSIVVAIKHEGKIYMAADTMVSYGNAKRQLTTPHTQKIWAVEDTPNCIMGGAGMLADINLIRYCGKHLIPELEVLKDELDIGVIMQTTVPQIFGLIKEYGEVCCKPEGSTIQSQFLIGVGSHLFAVYEDGCVEEEEDFIAIGSGSDMALGSLYTTEGEDITMRLIKAIAAASSVNLYCGAPYVAINNDDCQLKSLEFVDQELVEATVEQPTEKSTQNKPKKEKRK